MFLEMSMKSYEQNKRTLTLQYQPTTYLEGILLESKREYETKESSRPMSAAALLKHLKSF
jgi:hypothetical protein